MSQIRFMIGVLVVALLGVLAFSLSRAQAQGGHARWEYKCLELPSARGFIKKAVPMFNAAGDEGWEMAAPIMDGVMCFKRRK